jgi:hypothetical protein
VVGDVEQRHVAAVGLNVRAQFAMVSTTLCQCGSAAGRGWRRLRLLGEDLRQRQLNFSWQACSRRPLWCS